MSDHDTLRSHADDTTTAAPHEQPAHQAAQVALPEQQATPRRGIRGVTIGLVALLVLIAEIGRAHV
jgi:hypothetical protein